MAANFAATREDASAHVYIGSYKGIGTCENIVTVNV